VDDCSVYRPKEGVPHGDLAWRPMRRGIADLHRRAEVSRKAAERYLDALAYRYHLTKAGRITTTAILTAAASATTTDKQRTAQLPSYPRLNFGTTLRRHGPGHFSDPRIRPLIYRFATAMGTGLVIAALSASATAFAATDAGASSCQPDQGQLTAAIAQTGQLGQIISVIAPIDQLNQDSLFHCGQ
jgi:hypothetical protein